MGHTLVIDLGDALATVSFSSEDLDMSMENVGQLRDALRSFLHGDDDEAPPRRARTKRQRPDEAAARPLRVWAKNNGYDIGDYGRIPVEVREAYQRSQDRPTPLTVANGQAVHNE